MNKLQTKDTLHKLSTKLIQGNNVLCIKDLTVKNMAKNHKLAKAIADASAQHMIKISMQRRISLQRDFVS